MKYKQPDDNNMPIIARETPTCSVMSGTKKHIDKITVSRRDEKTVRPKADAVINTKPRNPISRNTNLRFMILFLSSFLFFLLLLLSANIYVDPRGVFGTGKYPVITATSRTEKIILLKAMEPKPEALIFGSSHCMRYSPKYVEDITGLKTFNFSVDSGKMEDFLALLNYSIEEIMIRPKLVILGVCPRTFCEMKDEDLDDRLVSNAVLLNYVPLKPISKIQKQAALYFKTLRSEE